MAAFIDLSQPIISGQQTYPWLPAPQVSDFLSRAESRSRYAPGTEFAIHRVELIGNSGTYLDSPYHRYADGTDLAGLPLARVANLEGVVIPVAGGARRAIEPDAIAHPGSSLRGTAVLFHTGWAGKWGTVEYPIGAPFISRAMAEVLVRDGAELVGIDALNVDDPADLTRPAHTILLAAGIPIVENLCRLEQLPATGFTFSAVPAPVRGCGSFPVRAFAIV